MAMIVISGPMMMDWHPHTHYTSSLREKLLSLWSKWRKAHLQAAGTTS